MTREKNPTTTYLTLGVSVAVILGLCLAALVSFSHYLDASARYDQLRQVAAESRSSRDSLVAMELVVERVSVGSANSVAPALSKIEADFQKGLDKISVLSGDDSVQQDRIATLRKTHKRWLTLFSARISERWMPNMGGLTQASGFAQTNLKQDQAHIQEIGDAASQKEEEQAQAAAKALWIAGLAGGAGVLFPLIFATILSLKFAGQAGEAALLRQRLDEEIEEHNQTVAHLQQAMENAKAAGHSKNEFLANMSHELRTPLNAIIGFAEILTEKTFGDLNSRQERYVSNILTSGQNLLKLINDIIDLAKIDSGRVEVESKLFDVSVCVGDVVTHLKVQAIGKNISLILEMESDLPQIRGDAAKIKEVVHNLVSNALKFTTDGGRINVRVLMIEMPEGQAGVRISVGDSGIGIKPADQDRIFGQFFQSDTGEARHLQGAGLSLALTRRYVEMHRGRIWVESEGTPGEGSTFFVEIPGEVLEAMPLKAEDLDGPLPMVGSTAALVLVVENEPKARELIGAYLNEAGYQVKYAVDGVQAVEMAHVIRPQAIILDVLLPKKDGWDVLTELKANPETRDIPVVVLSVSENRELGFSLGAVDYFVKPVGREQLTEAVRNAMSHANVRKRGEFTVLVIDDEPMNVELLIDMLHVLECKVLLAYGGQQGITVAIDRRPDLIILDLMMPLVTGFDVVRELRNHPEAKFIPILVLTSKEITEEDRRALNNQVTAIVPRAGKEALLEEIARLGISKSIG